MVAADNPIITRRYRAGVLESIHRGAWAVVDTAGSVVASAGDPDQPIFARSSSKSLQAAPLIAAGVADRFGLTPPEIALMGASHNGEPSHVDGVRRFLARVGLDESVLRCGRAAPMGDELAAKSRIQHCCSGKHAGFLAAAVAFGDDPADYLEPSSQVQQTVKAGVADMVDLHPDDLLEGIDGCSAPTFVFPLRRLGQGLARIATPTGISSRLHTAAFTIADAVAAHPHMVAGSRPLRFDTDIMSVTGGRLFAKGGADGVRVIAVRGADIAFCGKSDDGNDRGLVAVAIEVLARLGHLSAAERQTLDRWGSPIITNADGLDVGRQELAPIDLPE